MTDDDGRYYVKIRRAAHIADVDPETVCQWIKAGLLPAYEIPSTGTGKRIHKRIAVADLTRFLKSWRKATGVANHDALGL